MIVKLLTEHHLEFLSLKGGCRGSSESTLVKIPHCCKSRAMAHIVFRHRSSSWFNSLHTGKPKRVLQSVMSQMKCSIISSGSVLFAYIAGAQWVCYKARLVDLHIFIWLKLYEDEDKRQSQRVLCKTIQNNI